MDTLDKDIAHLVKSVLIPYLERFAKSTDSVKKNYGDYSRLLEKSYLIGEYFSNQELVELCDKLFSRLITVIDNEKFDIHYGLLEIYKSIDVLVKADLVEVSDDMFNGVVINFLRAVDPINLDVTIKQYNIIFDLFTIDHNSYEEAIVKDQLFTLFQGLSERIADYSKYRAHELKIMEGSISWPYNMEQIIKFITNYSKFLIKLNSHPEYHVISQRLYRDLEKVFEIFLNFWFSSKLHMETADERIYLSTLRLARLQGGFDLSVGSFLTQLPIHQIPISNAMDNVLIVNFLEVYIDLRYDKLSNIHQKHPFLIFELLKDFASKSDIRNLTKVLELLIASHILQDYKIM